MKESIFKRETRLLGLDLRKVSIKAGVSETTIQKWCTGKTRPALKNVDKLKKIGFSDGAIVNPSRQVD